MSKLLKERWMRLAFGSNLEAVNEVYGEPPEISREDASDMLRRIRSGESYDEVEKDWPDEEEDLSGEIPEEEAIALTQQALQGGDPPPEDTDLDPCLDLSGAPSELQSDDLPQA